MKRGTFLFLLILIPLASAIPGVTFQHNETIAGETIFGSIENPGGFAQDLSSQNIKFFEGRKEIFMEHDVLFNNNSYYFYVYSTRTGNFTIKFSDILYKEEGILKEYNSEMPLVITDGKFFSQAENKTIKQILSIKPGFFFSTQVPSIKLTNKGDIILNITFNEEEISLQPFETKSVEFEPTETFSFAKFSTYKEFLVPIVYLSAGGIVYTAPDNPLLKASPNVIFANIILGETNEQIIQLFNLGDENMTEFKISASQSFVDFNTFDEIPARGIHNLSLEITPDRDGFIDGELNISYLQSNKTHLLRIPISLYVLPKGSSTNDFKETNQTCEVAGGIVCEESCDGSAKFTSDGQYCCFGTCVPYDITDSSGDDSSGGSGGSSGWIWAIIIFAVLGGVGFWIYKRKKKVKNPSAEDKIKESSEKYSKRIQGGLER